MVTVRRMGTGRFGIFEQKHQQQQQQHTIISDVCICKQYIMSVSINDFLSERLIFMHCMPENQTFIHHNGHTRILKEHVVHRKYQPWRASIS